MSLSFLIFSLVLYFFCSIATIFYTSNVPNQQGTLSQQLAAIWGNQSADRDEAIGVHVLFLMCIVMRVLFTTDDYHIVLSYMALFMFLTHAYLLRIPNNLHDFVEWAAIFFDAIVVGLEVWSAMSSLH